MDKFYVIKVINRSGERGYVIDSPQGILISKEGITSDITQFKTDKEAEKFIRERKLERKGTRAFVRTNEDLMNDKDLNKLSPVMNDMFYLEDDQGNKCFYDAKEEGYFFENRDVGYCVWNTEKDVQEFSSIMQEGWNDLPAEQRIKLPQVLIVKKIEYKKN